MLIQSHLSNFPASLKCMLNCSPQTWCLPWMVDWCGECCIGLARCGFRFVFWLGLERCDSIYLLGVTSSVAPFLLSQLVPPGPRLSQSPLNGPHSLWVNFSLLCGDDRRGSVMVILFREEAWRPRIGRGLGGLRRPKLPKI